MRNLESNLLTISLFTGVVLIVISGLITQDNRPELSKGEVGYSMELLDSNESHLEVRVTRCRYEEPCGKVNLTFNREDELGQYILTNDKEWVTMNVSKELSTEILDNKAVLQNQ